MAGRGAEHVVAAIGPTTLEQSIKATAIEGQITTIGWLPTDVSTINYAALNMSLTKLRVIFAGSRAQFSAMNRAITQNQLKPVIGRIFPFEEAKTAYRYYEEAQPFGKVIIRGL